MDPMNDEHADQDTYRNNNNCGGNQGNVCFTHTVNGFAKTIPIGTTTEIQFMA